MQTLAGCGRQQKPEHFQSIGLARRSAARHMAAMAKGLYRDGDWAQVSYTGRASIPMRRDQYEAAGYQPPFADLRTKKEYEAWNGAVAES